MSSTDDSLHRAEELLARLEAARGELDQLASGESSSPDRALEILGELSELAKSVEEGSVIPPYYDSLIAKLVVRDNNRDLAIVRARRALEEFDIGGVPTTREAAFEILGSDEFRSGDYSTSFIDEAGAKLPALAGG